MYVITVKNGQCCTVDIASTNLSPQLKFSRNTIHNVSKNIIFTSGLIPLG